MKVKVRDDMELANYNGWENKFTWLIDLHLSNEQEVMNEIVDLVTQTSNERAAGLAVAYWVQMAVNGWVTGFAGRETFYDEPIRLLVWDLVGSALAHTDWESLVKLLMGQKLLCDNPFSWTLYKSMTTVPYFQQGVSALLLSASSLYSCADALHEWVRGEIDAWMDVPPTQRSLLPALVMLVHTLLQDTYSVVAWEHVARAFRPE